MNVKELLDFEEIPFREKGKDLLVRCLNPEHEDRNPSMHIDKVTGVFQCFSCGYKGNLFALFEQNFDKLQMLRDSLKEKVRRKKAESIGLQIPSDAVPYTGDWRGISPETYQKFEAFQHHSKDFIGRIVFPVRNISGKIVLFIGRHTGTEVPKYRVVPQGARVPLFPKVEPIQGRVILVEGIYDMLNLHDKGLTNAIACFGVSTVTPGKLCMLRIQGVTGVDIFFDGDDAGQQGAEKVKKLCRGANLNFTNTFIDGSDPGELSKAQVTKLYGRLYK